MATTTTSVCRSCLYVRASTQCYLHVSQTSVSPSQIRLSSSLSCALASKRSSRLLSGRGRVEFQVRDGLDSASDQPPSSRADAVRQAGASLAALLEKSLKKQGPATVKQRKDQRQLRLRVEIPELDDSPASLLTLSLDLVSAFASGKKGLLTDIALCFADTSLLELAREGRSSTNSVPRLHFLSLVEAAAVPQACSCVFVVGPQLLHAPAIAKIATQAGTRPVVAVNPYWPEEEDAYAAGKALLSSFEVAYSFTAICIQGFFSKTEGVVMKHAKSGAPSGRPWLIYVKEGGKYKCVSSLKSRPGAAELETALYNFIAANSPITKSIGFLRGLVTRQ